MEEVTVSINGQITDGNSAKVPVLDHGFLFGEGIYETLRTYNHQPFLLDRHLDRLRVSADGIGLSVPLTDQEFIQRIEATMARSNVSIERYIRLLITRGVGELNYDPLLCKNPTVVIIIKPHPETAAKILERGITIVVSSILRNHPRSVNPRIKSNNLLNNALAMQEALRNGADEALMHNHRGEIAECAQANLFIVRDGEAITPSIETGLLEGVTRNFIFEVGHTIGIPVRSDVLHDSDLETADEIFITSSTREVLPVTTVDGRPVGKGLPGPITQNLADAFRLKADQLTRS
jgi:branched-chain amino acid aminotransferase